MIQELPSPEYVRLDDSSAVWCAGVTPKTAQDYLHGTHNKPLLGGALDIIEQGTDPHDTWIRRKDGCRLAHLIAEYGGLVRILACDEQQRCLDVTTVTPVTVSPYHDAHRS